MIIKYTNKTFVLPSTTQKLSFLIIFCFIIGVCLNQNALAEIYWISPDGEASWSTCKGINPLNSKNACSLEMANKNAVAGDIVYLREGTYIQTKLSGCNTDFVCGIFPKNNGTKDAKITFSAYKDEKPIITSEPNLTSGIGITLKGSKFIRITGITFKNLYRWVEIYNYASFNEIDHCTFYSETGEDFGGAAGINISSLCAGGNSWTCYSKHNWIHHNILLKAHEYGEKPCNEGADLIRIGSGYSSLFDNQSTTEQCDYNTVEDNIIAYAGHALMDTYGGKNVIKNNFFHNEAWIPDYSNGKCNYPPMPNGKYSHRGLQTSEDFGRDMQYILVEGNRFGFSSANPNNPGDANYAIASSATIVRYNTSFGAHQSGIGTKWYRAFPNGIITQLSNDIDDTTTNIPVASTEGVKFHYYYIKIDDERIQCLDKDDFAFLNCTRGYLSTNKGFHKKGTSVFVNSYSNRGQGGTGPYKIRIYNNTSFWNGYTYPYMQSSQPGCATCPGKLAGINIYSLAWDVIIKNNIVYNNYSYILYGNDITVNTGEDPTNYPNIITIENNWTTTDGDPRFNNPDTSDPTNEKLPDLSLQPNSEVIDKARHLTTAKNSGENSTILIVEDAMYFQDGTWGSDLARGVTMFPDWIAIGSIKNIAEIKSIDYLTNTIILNSITSWNEGDRIWLYKKSDGKCVLFGAYPDLGAHEFVPTLEDIENFESNDAIYYDITIDNYDIEDIITHDGENITKDINNNELHIEGERLKKDSGCSCSFIY